MKKRLAAIATAGIALTGITSTPASAVPDNYGVNYDCGYYDLHYYYNSGGFGACVAISGTINNFGATSTHGAITFRSWGEAGGGQALKNNAATAVNASASTTYFVYYQSGLQGTVEVIGPQSRPSCTDADGWSRFCNVYNENASQSSSAG